MPLRLLTGIALVVLVTGCSGSVSRDDVRRAGGSITGLEVTGAPGTAPVVRMAPPLKVTETRSETVVEGTGPALGIDELLVLQLTMYDGRTGKKVKSTYDPGETAQVVKSGSLAPELAEAIVGQRQGSRVVLALAEGSATVLIADIIAVPPAETLEMASGDPKSPSAGLPRLVLRAGIPARLDFSGAGAEPTGVVVATLIAGDGPAIRDDSLVTLKALGQGWGRRVPHDDSFAKEPALIPIGIRDHAWDSSLVGVRRGSRLLVIAPPKYAFAVPALPLPLTVANGTNCYLIDILGVS